MQEAVKIVICFLMITAVPSFSVAASMDSPEGLVESIVKQDWGKVSEIIGTDTEFAQDIVGRVLTGHASLALGVNNIATKLFAVSQDSVELLRWRKWCDALAEDHSTSASIAYLIGDAAARTGDYDRAIKFLSKAIEIDDSFALAYNARGVVGMTVGKRDQAYDDFMTVLEKQPGFADAHANLGAYCIQGGCRSKDAVRHLESALKIDKTFYMVHNSMACISAVLERDEEAYASLTRADSLSEGKSTYVIRNGKQMDRKLNRTSFADREEGDIRGGFQQATLGLEVNFIPPVLQWLATAKIYGELIWDRGGVYLPGESVDVVSSSTHARYVTDYVLGYQRGWVEGKLTKNADPK
jgi:tetratricopeptide (TPR) repeat protein